MQALGVGLSLLLQSQLVVKLLESLQASFERVSVFPIQRCTNSNQVLRQSVRASVCFILSSITKVAGNLVCTYVDLFVHCSLTCDAY